MDKKEYGSSADSQEGGSADVYEEDVSSDGGDEEAGAAEGGLGRPSSVSEERDLEDPAASVQEGDDADGGAEVAETAALLPQTPPVTVNRIPYYKRTSYLRIQRRLKSVRIRAALLSSGIAFLCGVGAAVVEMTYGNQDFFFSGVFIGCVTFAFSLAVAAVVSRSHLLFVGVMLLQIVIALYCVAFGLTGIGNYFLLEKERENNLTGDPEHEEQYQNMLEIYRRMAIREVVLAALFFALALTYCCSTLFTNHVRAAVRPFDERLVRKRHRERAFDRLGITPSKNYFEQLSELEEEQPGEAAGSDPSSPDALRTEGSALQQEEDDEQQNAEAGEESGEDSEAGEESGEDSEAGESGASEEVEGETSSHAERSDASELQEDA